MLSWENDGGGGYERVLAWTVVAIGIDNGGSK